MYEWIPKRTNKRVQNVVILLIVAASAALAVPMLFGIDGFRWAFQLTSIGCMTAVIFLVTRYLTKIFIYAIRERDGGALDLTVTEAKQNGKGQITVCRVGLSGIRVCRVLDETTDPNARACLTALKKQRKKIFNYCVDIHPAQSILLAVEEGGEELWLELSYSPELLARLGGVCEREESSDE